MSIIKILNKIENIWSVVQAGSKISLDCPFKLTSVLFFMVSFKSFGRNMYFPNSSRQFREFSFRVISLNTFDNLYCLSTLCSLILTLRL